MITRQIQIAIPGCEVAGFLYSADSAEALGEDMLDVSLPGGVLVTAGWYLEGAASGQYRVSVYDHDEIVVSLFSLDVDQAARDVRHLSNMILRGELPSIAKAIRAGA